QFTLWRRCRPLRGERIGLPVASRHGRSRSISTKRHARCPAEAVRRSVMMRRLTIAFLALVPWAVPSGAAAKEEPKVMPEATLDAAEGTPPPVGGLAGAGGTATFEYDETDKSLTYTVTVQNLTGPPIAAHIHEAPAGTPGPVRVTLDQNNLAGGAPALPVP